MPLKHPFIFLTSWLFVIALLAFLFAPTSYFNDLIEQEDFYLDSVPAQNLYYTIVDSSGYRAIDEFLSPKPRRHTPKNIEDFGSSLFGDLKGRFDIFVKLVCISFGRAHLTFSLSFIGLLLAVPAAYGGLMMKRYKAAVFEPPSLSLHKSAKVAIGLLLVLLAAAIIAPVEISPFLLGAIPIACFLSLGVLIANGK